MGELLFCFSLNKLDKGVQFSSLHSSKLPAWDVFVPCGEELRGAWPMAGGLQCGRVKVDLTSSSRISSAQLCPGCEVSVSWTRGLSHLPIQTLPQPGNLGSCIQSKPPITLFRHCNGNAFLSIYLCNFNYFYNYKINLKYLIDICFFNCPNLCTAGSVIVTGVGCYYLYLHTAAALCCSPQPEL